MIIPVTPSQQSKARLVAATRTKRWRDQRKADALTDAAIVQGLVEAVSGYVTADGRMKARVDAVDLHSAIVGAMACLKISGDLETREAMDRVIARLTHAAKSRPSGGESVARDTVPGLVDPTHLGHLRTASDPTFRNPRRGRLPSRHQGR
ncbi:hypothetical protein [Methylobacterium sp. J-067]|uniref:hypothetical protein n=1 Tax=Methylobacterium sp. J-067 TaxID=2836648 RepID=UPI001FB9B35F|nr:hypothetical protein [Methylobacterium sp. J-067]